MSCIPLIIAYAEFVEVTTLMGGTGGCCAELSDVMLAPSDAVLEVVPTLLCLLLV